MKFLACAAETWGFVHVDFNYLLRDLATLASRRQIERGMLPTKWYSRWKLLISLRIPSFVGEAIFDSLPQCVQWPDVGVGGAFIFESLAGSADFGLIDE